MNISNYLTAVSMVYDRLADMSSEGQRLLRASARHLAEHAPGGIIIEGSGGKGRPTFTPWVGFFDPDETVSPEEGLYVVYIFAIDLAHVTLSVMQGITALSKELGPGPARTRLAADAAAIRNGLASDSKDWSPNMSLGTKGFRQLAYEAGNVLARQYALQDLPSEAALRHDLQASMGLYQLAIEVKRGLLQSSPGAIASPSVLQRTGSVSDDPLAGFKPENDSDYRAALTGRVRVKSRRHERLLRDYATWAEGCGFLPVTQHPRDLVLRKGDQEWLIEGKVLYHGNASDAVGAALGQLYAYQHFLYPAESPPRVLALFSEPIGEAFTAFLERAGVASVWRREGGWAGSANALAAGLAQPSDSG